MKGQLFILILLAPTLCSSCVGIDLNRGFETFLNKSIQYFQPIAHRRQFAVLLMLSQEDVETWEVNYEPHNENGMPLISKTGPISPSNRNEYGNYIAARPNGSTQHSEYQIMRNLPDLLQSFQRNHNGNSPAAIILHSRIVPCIDCTNYIIRSVNNLNLPEGVHRIVTYTTNGTGVPNVDLDYAERQLTCSYFQVFPFHPKGRRFKRLISNSVDHDQNNRCVSIQRHLLDLLGNSLECCISSPQYQRPTADLINRLMASCFLELDKLDLCLGKAAKKVLGGNCKCFNSVFTPSLLSKHVKKALDSPFYFISHPLNPNDLTHIMKAITDQAQLQAYDVNVNYTCKDIRMEGLMCTSWKSNYLTANRDLCTNECTMDGYSYSWCYLENGRIFYKWDYCCSESCQSGWCKSGTQWRHCTGDIGYVTAGNTMCKVETPCGLHGYKSAWCRTDYGWEYCCTSSCGIGYGKSWCTSANTWEYCGEYEYGQGLSTVDEKDCLLTHPCGKHDYKSDSYWCYTDTKNNWNYCCAPGQTTSNDCSTSEYMGSKGSEEELP